MLALTSISPNHSNFESQTAAVRSWTAAGFRVISLNPRCEIELLINKFPDVNFVVTDDISTEFKKKTVVISAFIEYAKTCEASNFLIINSDIIINDSRRITQNLLIKAERGLVVLSRYDYVNNINSSTKYDLGFDGFIINKKYLRFFPATHLCIGQCFWDYWLPYTAILNKVPLFKLGTHYIFHKRHEVQYDRAEYEVAAEIFRSEIAPLDTAITKLSIEHMSSHIFNKIRKS